MSVNKAILLGNLGADPELRYVAGAGGKAVCEFRMATTEKFKRSDGAPGEDTQWHRIVVWGPQAEHCKTYLAKGRQVFVEGRIRTREWQDKDGHKRWTTEVVAHRVQFVGGPRANGGNGTAAAAMAPEPESAEFAAAEA